MIDSRTYPVRIHAGHFGRARVWAPELMDQREAAHTCEYVRADVVADMLAVLVTLANDRRLALGGTHRKAINTAIAKADKP